MNALKAILVEDEPSGMENLRWKLQNNCPEVEIVAECTNGKDAIQAIKRQLPDLLFLDIRLGDMTGFDVLKEIKHPSFEVIFTTSYDEFAIEAIKNSALDYLLKPLDVDELMDAVAKAKVKFSKGAFVPLAPTVLVGQSSRMGFPVPTGKLFLDIEDVLYAKADDNISILTVGSEEGSIKLTKPLSWVEAKLEDRGFCRIHHSYLINLNHLKEFIRNDGGYAVMSDGKAISVSRRRKDDFLQTLEKWNGSSD
ncbi:LytTR family DNA-binding domain-containing protein [bacterium]|nr:LytTR family DNA-binding domain-containing protein [bacterium]